MLSKEDLEKVCAVEPKVKFFKRENEDMGDVIIARNVDTKKQYLIKEKVYTDMEEFRLAVAKATNRMGLSHPQLLQLYDFSTVTKVDKASKCYKLRLFFDYWANSLNQELSARKEIGEDFPTEELMVMAYDLISACAYLEEKGGNHGDINPGVVHINDDHRYILADRLKHKARFPQNVIDKVMRNDPLYIAPEAYRCIKTRDHRGMASLDPYKCDVFSLGLVLLSVGLMTDVADVYSKSAFEIDRSRLNRHIGVFESRYISNPLICVIVKKMLEVDEFKRPTFSDLQHALPDKRVIKEYFSKLKAANPSCIRKARTHDMMQLMAKNKEKHKAKTNINGDSSGGKLDAKETHLAKRGFKEQSQQFRKPGGNDVKAKALGGDKFGGHGHQTVEKHSLAQHEKWMQGRGSPEHQSTPQTAYQNHHKQHNNRHNGYASQDSRPNTSMPKPSNDLNPLLNSINFFDQQSYGGPTNNGRVPSQHGITGYSNDSTAYDSRSRLTGLAPPRRNDNVQPFNGKEGNGSQRPNAQLSTALSYNPVNSVNNAQANVNHSPYASPYDPNLDRNAFNGLQSNRPNNSYGTTGNSGGANSLKRGNTVKQNQRPMQSNAFRKNSDSKKTEGDKKGFKIF